MSMINKKNHRTLSSVFLACSLVCTDLSLSGSGKCIHLCRWRSSGLLDSLLTQRRLLASLSEQNRSTSTLWLLDILLNQLGLVAVVVMVMRVTVRGPVVQGMQRHKLDWWQLKLRSLLKVLLRLDLRLNFDLKKLEKLWIKCNHSLWIE